jgi:hypothetical protein
LKVLLYVQATPLKRIATRFFLSSTAKKDPITLPSTIVCLIGRQMKKKPAMYRTLSSLANDIGWGHIVSSAYLHSRGAAQQVAEDLKFDKPGAACTLHAIVNAWARVLNLRPDPGFVPSAIFYREPLAVVNLASAGRLDSACIYAWPLCQGFADAEIAEPCSMYPQQTFQEHTDHQR